MNDKLNRNKRKAFPKTLPLHGGAVLSRFNFKKLNEYLHIEITNEQSKMIENQPIRTLFRKLPSLGCGKLYLIEQGGKVRGYIGLWANPRIGKFNVAPLIIDKNAQGRGLGRAALEGALKMLFDSGASRVALAVHPDNANAIRLYESLGFKFTGGKWGNDRVMRMEFGNETCLRL